MKKFFLAGLLLYSLFVFLPSNATAQQMPCQWDAISYGAPICVPPLEDPCPSGYTPNPYECDFPTRETCELAVTTCITLEEAANLAKERVAPEPPPALICEGTGIQTAIGCVFFDNPNVFVGFFLRWAIGIGGGIAFLLILYAGFTIMTSSGNPDRLKSGQALLTSAIAGLIMLIFSIFILRIIGVDILKIPGFGG